MMVAVNSNALCTVSANKVGTAGWRESFNAAFRGRPLRESYERSLARGGRLAWFAADVHGARMPAAPHAHATPPPQIAAPADTAVERCTTWTRYAPS